MTECEREGINGNCGLECEVYLAGDCDCAADLIRGSTTEELKVYKRIYGGDK